MTTSAVLTVFRPRLPGFLPWLILAIGLLGNSANAKLPVIVEISGIDQKLEKNVRLFLGIEQQKDHPLLTEGRLKRLHRKAEQEISDALQPYGYYRPKVESSLKKTDTGEWRAIYAIDPGPPLPIAEFNLRISPEMAMDPEFDELLKDHALQPGATFDHVEYETFKSSLGRLAAERGYFDAKFVVHRIEIDLDSYGARVFLEYAGGPRYKFGAVNMRQDMLDEQLLNRYLPFESGDPYHIDKLIDLQRALNDTYYFQSVLVSAGKPLPGSSEVPIDVVLTPRKRHRYEVGLGYGTDTGARARFGWLLPRINERGHRFNTDLEVSEIGYDAVARYRIPVFNPRTDQLVYSIGQTRKQVEDTDSTLRTLGVSLSHSRGNWRETLSLNYQQEKFQSGDDEGDSTLLIPVVSWSRTWGNDFINVLDGLRFNLSLRGANENLVSDTDFEQLRAGLKFIYSLGPRDRFIARGEAGTTSTSEFSQLPSSVRFFAGGAQSVRGYRYESLGPKDDDGDVVGGRHLLLGGIEFEHYFNDRWGAAVFFDAGNAINDIDDDLEKGAGFGLRWKSPVGPVRIDMASAITRDGDPWRLHINIGPDL